MSKNPRTPGEMALDAEGVGLPPHWATRLRELGYATIDDLRGTLTLGENLDELAILLGCPRRALEQERERLDALCGGAMEPAREVPPMGAIFEGEAGSPDMQQPVPRDTSEAANAAANKDATDKEGGP